MQSPEEKERNARVIYLIGIVTFVFLMLIALGDMHAAWKVTHDWNLRRDLLAPWLFLGLGGLVLWRNTVRKKIERDVAGGLLLVIAVAVHFSYEAMGRLAATHF